MMSIRSISLSILVLSVLQSQYTSTEGFAAKNKAKSSGGGGFGVAKSVLTHTPDASKETQALLKFLKSQKAKGLADCEIGTDETSGVRGMFATKNFKKGAFLCQIPSDAALALSDPSQNGEDAPTSAHGGANFLRMYIHDPKAKKLWAPYLNTLPTQGGALFDPTPDFMDEEELELLEFPRAIQVAKSRKEEVTKLAAEQGLDVDELQFATWLTTSRAFAISMSTESEESDKAMLENDAAETTGAESSSSSEEATTSEGEKETVVTKAESKTIRVMVPFIDMVNHNSNEPNAKLTLIDPEKDEAWFALEATRPIKAGKEIAIAYGTGVESSVELFLNYGFIPKTNKMDEFMLEKGGDDAITSLDGWTTTLEEDQSMLGMAEGDSTLQKILNFRIRLKESYK
ncbi:MAG: hypothetical protein SGBAC_001551 [Bacillariaceae sp.]